MCAELHTKLLLHYLVKFDKVYRLKIKVVTANKYTITLINITLKTLMIT